jgi:hypothetical protein
MAAEKVPLDGLKACIWQAVSEDTPDQEEQI